MTRFLFPLELGDPKQDPMKQLYRYLDRILKASQTDRVNWQDYLIERKSYGSSKMACNDRRQIKVHTYHGNMHLAVAPDGTFMLGGDINRQGRLFRMLPFFERWVRGNVLVGVCQDERLISPSYYGGDQPRAEMDPLSMTLHCWQAKTLVRSSPAPMVRLQWDNGWHFGTLSKAALVKRDQDARYATHSHFAVDCFLDSLQKQEAWRKRSAKLQINQLHRQQGLLPPAKKRSAPVDRSAEITDDLAGAVMVSRPRGHKEAHREQDDMAAA